VLALGLAFLGRTTVAVGATGSISAAIELSTPGCGSLAELNEQILRRSSRIRLDRPSRLARSMKAEIKEVGAGRREVVLTVAQESGQPFSRRLVAPSCDEAIAALALLIVLALDPEAVTAQSSPKSPPPAARASLSGTAGSKASKRPATGQGLSTSAERAEPGERGERDSRSDRTEALDKSTEATSSASSQAAPTPPDVAVPQTDATPSEAAAAGLAPAAAPPGSNRSWRGLLVGGASGLGIMGPTPRTLVGGSLFAVWGWDRDSLWSPAIAIAVGHSERNGLEQLGGTASFVLTAAQLEVCPVWIGMHRRLGARACALAVAGVLTAEGTQTLAPEVQRRAFALFGGSAALMYEPAWRVVLVASGGLGVPLQRYAYQFEPDVFYRAAPVAVTASLGIGLRLY
jgi:hypothetical protein